MIAARVVASPTRHSPTAPGRVLIETGSMDNPKQGKVMSEVQGCCREQDKAFYEVDLQGGSTRWIQHLSRKTIN